MASNDVMARGRTAIAWAVFGSGGKIAGQLVVQITLARLLGPQAFGEFAAVTVVMALVALLTDCGLSSALIRKKDIGSEDVGFALGRTLALGGVTGTFIFLTAPVLSGYFGDALLAPMFRFCAFLAVVQGPMNIALALLRRELDIKRVQIIHLVSYTLVYGGVAISLTLMGWGAWGLVVGYFAQSVFTLVAACSVYGAARPKLHGDPEMVRFGLRSLQVELSSWSMETLDQLLVGKFWGVNSLGLYVVAMNLCRAPTGLLITMLQNIAFSGAARLQDDPALVRRGYLVAVTAMALSTLPLFVLVSYEAATVLAVVYGSRWLMATPIMAAVALSMPLAVLGSISAAVLRGIGAVESELRAQLMAGLVLFGGFISMTGFPLDLVVWTVPIAYGLRLAALLWAACRQLELRLTELVSPLRGAALLAAFGVCVAAGTEAIPGGSSSAGGVLPLVAGCCAIVLPCLWRFSWFAGKPLTQALRSGSYGGPFHPVVEWLVRTPR